MQTRRKWITGALLAAGVTATAAATAAWNGNGWQSVPWSNLFSNVHSGSPERNTRTARSLSTAEMARLQYQRESEKLARDLFEYYHSLWGETLFQQAADTESDHLGRVGRMVDRYGVEDPVQSDQPGQYQDPDLNEAWQQLQTRGAGSLLDALLAGALVEEVAIRDLADDMEETRHSALMATWALLMRDSRRLLRDLVDRLAEEGVNYEPQVLTQATFDALVDRGDWNYRDYYDHWVDYERDWWDYDWHTHDCSGQGCDHEAESGHDHETDSGDEDHDQEHGGDHWGAHDWRTWADCWLGWKC